MSEELKLTHDELNIEFSKICDAVEAQASPFEEHYLKWLPVTKPLHHYTSLEGVHGILKSRGLWATSVDYLNDSTEISYGLSLIQEAIKTEQRKWQSKLATFLQLLRLETHIREHRTKYAYYVACFCDKEDLLSQWRAYGSAGGFSLAMYLPEFHQTLVELDKKTGKLFDEDGDRTTVIVPVIYGRDKQLEIVNTVLTAAINAFERVVQAHNLSQHTEWLLNNEEAESFLSECATYFATKLLKFIPLFKDPAFKEEDEWRLVHRRPANDFAGVDFRIGKNTLVPYVEVKFDVDKSLSYLRYGPLTTQPAVQSIWSFMRAQGLEEKPIERASAPLQ